MGLRRLAGSPATAGPDRLADACYEEVKGRWEEDFERRYGFWRGSAEDAVYGFPDCAPAVGGRPQRCTEE